MLDADGEALGEGIKAKPFMIKPNRDEAERLLNKEFTSKADVARAALEIAEQGIELVVISLGKQGVIAAYEGVIYEVTPPDVKSLSTVGSGDSLIAGIMSGFDQGLAVDEALCMGCAAGAATAMSSGADIGSKSDADKLLSAVRVSKIQPA